MTPVHRHDLHAFFRWLYHVPILLGAFWFGLRGGAGTALLVTVVYLPHLLFQWQGGHAVQWLELALYNVVGWVTGWLAQGLREESERHRKAAAALDGALGELRRQTRLILETEELLLRAGKLSALGELGATLAHEVRTPLASIRGTAEILSDAFEEGDERYEFARILLRETERLNGVVTGFLGFARPADGRTNTADVDVSVVEVLGLVRSHADRQGVALRHDSPGRRLDARIDAEHLRQVLLNLVVNAIQAMPDGGEVRVETAVADEDSVHCAVEDDGPGVAAPDRERIFEPFVTTKSEGTGLGLPLVRRLVEGYGGSVVCESREHGGARFVVRLPRGEDADGG